MLDLVIAHYNADLTWIKQLKDHKLLNIIIYSKCKKAPKEFFNIPVIKLENRGREGGTYIHHILSSYKRMNKNHYTIFCQDDPFEHQPNFIQVVRYLLKTYKDSDVLPKIYPLNSHAYQEAKKDHPDKDRIVMEDIFSYEEYSKKRKYYKSRGKIFMNSYPPKKLNQDKSTSIFTKEGRQVGQVNIVYLNTLLDSLNLPDSNPFIWDLYKGISDYLGCPVSDIVKENLVILPFLLLFYRDSRCSDRKKFLINKEYLKRILNTKIIPYNPSAQFLLSNKVILENDLYIYKNIGKFLYQGNQPILVKQGVELNGFILEFLWLYIFNFNKYYINSLTRGDLKKKETGESFITSNLGYKSDIIGKKYNKNLRRVSKKIIIESLKKILKLDKK